MKNFTAAKAGGKTTAAIREAARTGAYMVCMNRLECERVARMAYEMGLEIAFPITFREFQMMQYHARGATGFVIDNADRFLEWIAGAVPVTMATWTGTGGSAREKIEEYHALCSKAYGAEPTEYQQGVLMGLECARAFVRHNKEHIGGTPSDVAGCCDGRENELKGVQL